MRNIAVVGAGQAGLLLAFGLLEEGYSVTVYSDRTPEQIFNTRLPATTYLFGRSTQYERELGLNFWDGPYEYAQGGDLDFCPAPAQRALVIRGHVTWAGTSIDLRVKHSRWLAEIERRGGSVVISPVSPEALDTLASRHELVFVTTGRNTQLFERNPSRSPHEKPQRSLLALLLTGMESLAETIYPALKLCLTPGHGEFFSMPYFDRIRGPCQALLIEAVPGGPMDRFAGLTSAQEALARARSVVQDYSPWVAEKLSRATVVDESAWLTGGFTPVVRDPVARLPSGRRVMGLGDAVILNDPIAGQGLNCASKMAHFFTQAILTHRSKPFTEDWMRETFERFWEVDGQYITAFTNMLLAPAPPHVQSFLGAASQVQAVADTFFRAFHEPPTLFPWILDPAKTEERVRELAAA